MPAATRHPAALLRHFTVLVLCCGVVVCGQGLIPAETDTARHNPEDLDPADSRIHRHRFTGPRGAAAYSHTDPEDRPGAMHGRRQRFRSGALGNRADGMHSRLNPGDRADREAYRQRFRSERAAVIEPGSTASQGQGLNLEGGAGMHSNSSYRSLTEGEATLGPSLNPMVAYEKVAEVMRSQGFSAEVVSAAATAAAAAATPEATQDEQAILEEPEIPTNSTGAAGNSTAQEQRPPPPPLPAFCEKYAKTFLPSIWLDLQPWSKGIKLETLSSGSRKYTMELRYPGMAVSFRGGKAYLFREANLANIAKHHAKEAIIYLEVLQDLARRYPSSIPDIDFVLASNDVPPWTTVNDPVDTNNTKTYLPQFRYCRSLENPGILIPVWQLYELKYSATFLNYIDTNFTNDPPWERRQPKLYARLGRWDRIVLPGSRLTYRNNIRTPRRWFTKWTRSLQDPKIDVKDGPFVPITSWREYKYLIHVDGISFSSKLEKLLSLGSPLMVEQSGYRAFYQMALRPYEHYVPFWFQRPQEALDALRWMENNQEAAKQIAKNAQAFVKENLNKQALRCYWLTLFREYAKLLAYDPSKVNHPTFQPVSDYLADFRVNKPNYTLEWHRFANRTGWEFDDAFGVPET